MNGILLFIILTVVYSVIRYKVTDKKLSMIWGIAYISVLLISFYFVNLSITKDMCGTTQAGTAFMVTLVPWFFVFIIMGLMLMVFPGWLAPFSNTFGYLFAKLAGLSTIMNKIIAPKIQTDVNNRAAANALQQIYGDQSLVVNQLTEANFEGFWSKMTAAKLFNPDADNYKDALLKMVRLKNTVAEAIWALLSGGVAISISNSFISGTACHQSAKEMMQRHNQFESEPNEKKEKRVYTLE